MVKGEEGLYEKNVCYFYSVPIGFNATNRELRRNKYRDDDGPTEKTN